MCIINSVTKTRTTITTIKLSVPRVPLFASPSRMDFSEQPRSGAAQRRRQRRLRSWLRHERMTVAMALAEKLHHSTRGQRMARAGEEDLELHYTAEFRTHPPPQAAGTVYFAMDVDDVPAAGAGTAAHHAADRRSCCRLSMILRRRWWNSC